jgi:PilZ domain
MLNATMQAKRNPKPNYVQRPPRHPISADVTVIDDLGRELESKLWNISEGGFMAECEEKLRIGQEIEVDLPDHGLVRAEVRWVLGWRFGAMILSPESSPAR